MYSNASPLLINSSAIEIKKLQVLLMKCSRPILGYQSLKWSTSKIMSKLNWLTIPHMIAKESILFLHKISFENIPKSLFNLYTYSHNNSKNIRTNRKIMVKNISNSEIVKKSLVFKSVYLMNTLPDEIIKYNTKKLSKYLQTNIQSYFHSDKICAYENG